MKNTLLALLLAPPLLTGCEPAQKTATPPAGLSRQPNGITNKYWKLVTLGGQPVTMAPDRSAKPTLCSKTAAA